MEGVLKLVKFILWIMLGIVVIPCAVLSAIAYPVWEKMGGEF